MEVRSDGLQQMRCDKIPAIERTRLKVWFIRVCSSILLWTCLVQLFAVGELWRPRFITSIAQKPPAISQPPSVRVEYSIPSPPPLPPLRNYSSNGFLRVTCNGGLNQMRAAICDMVTVARFLNLTLVVPELDKTSFWADTSDFEDIFDVKHFIASLRDEVRIIKRLPKRVKNEIQPLVMQPISWSSEKYYFEQVLPLFNKYKVIHFNKTDARLANNGLPLDFQRIRCRVNFQALKFTPKIEALGRKLIQILGAKGPFIALHLRYEMDMLAFSGCNHGCSDEEAAELKQMRYAYPWWRDKEINSEEKRSQGLCPLTPEETVLILQALGFDKNIQIYIASGETYGSERRLAALRAAFPNLRERTLYTIKCLNCWLRTYIGLQLCPIDSARSVHGLVSAMKKDMLLDPDDLRQFRNHSSQMAALDFMVSVASNIFIPTYDGNMARLVEGHRRYLGSKKTILLDRKRLVELLDSHQNGTLPWDEFAVAVKEAHENRSGQPVLRRLIPDKPKEEDYFYSNPQECLCHDPNCIDLLAPSNTTQVLV